MTHQQVCQELVVTRESIGDLANEALAEAWLEVRVDHRSLRDQGIDQTPGVHLGPARVKRITGKKREEHARTRTEKNRPTTGRRLPGGQR